MNRNGGSLPPRLPDLSQILKALQRMDASFTIVALSYRGFWTSRGSASERGIKLDAEAAISWVHKKFPGASIILWGQSIGAGVATSTAASVHPEKSRVDALILETPFTSIRDMLTAMYPQKWLPYRYLHPFLRNHWDSREALRRLSDKPQILILAAERDELVLAGDAGELESVCMANDIPAKRIVIPGALHHEVLTKPQGRKAIVDFLTSFSHPP